MPSIFLPSRFGWPFTGRKSSPPLTPADLHRAWAKIAAIAAARQGVNLPQEACDWIAGAREVCGGPFERIVRFHARFDEAMKPYRGFQGGDGI